LACFKPYVDLYLHDQRTPPSTRKRFLLVQQPPRWPCTLNQEISRSHTTTHQSQQDFSGRVISPSQIPLPDNTQQSQQTDIHTAIWIRTRNPNKLAPADRRQRQPGQWNRLKRNLMPLYIVTYCKTNSGYDSSAALENRYRLEGTRVETRCGRNFSH
jgi:hypothetical protein